MIRPLFGPRVLRGARHVVACALVPAVGLCSITPAARASLDVPELLSYRLMVTHPSTSPGDTTAGMMQELQWLRAESIIITSASRHEEELFKTAAAVCVVTADDIQRSGARNLPDMLRLVPGMSVAQMDANKWAITSRGFNSRFADKLLVLIDGRTVYTPSFSGVYWDMQDYNIADIDRIEVIHGPGGTLWGANAVNGVVNIITRSASRAQPGRLTVGYGTDEGGASLRSSAGLGERGDLRAYVKARRLDDLKPTGFDGWDFLQGGFRSDWKQARTSVTFQGDFYLGKERQQLVMGHLPPVPYGGTEIDTLDEKYDVDGQNLLVRVGREQGAGSNWQLQAYWDRTNRTDRGVSGYRNTFDLDFQHRFSFATRHDVTYGMGYRFLPDHFRNPDLSYINWDPAERDWQLFSAFVQDEVALVEHRLRLTLGSKFEHNDVTGFEIQPNVRLALTPNDRFTLWSAVSRAVQTPGRNLDGVKWLVIPTHAADPLTVIGVGSQDVESTELIAYELGERWSPTDAVSTDLSLFYNDYDKFIDGVVSVDLAAGLVRNTATSAGHGRSYGGESSVTWRASDAWRWIAAYAYCKVELEGVSNALFAEGRDPLHQAWLRASWNVTRSIDVDLFGKYTDALRSYSIPAHADMDARAGWRVAGGTTVEVVGRNLFTDRRYEFGIDQFTPTLVNPVARTVVGRISFEF